jgi:hypothetical protein
MSLRPHRLLAMDAANPDGGYPNIAVFMRCFEVSERTVHGDRVFRRSRLKTQLTFRHGKGMRAE